MSKYGKKKSKSDNLSEIDFNEAEKIQTRLSHISAGDKVSEADVKNNLCDGDAGYAKSSFYVKGDKDKQLEKTIEAELGEWERFARPNPNDLWQMDIMSFYIRDQHKVYLISALDDCSRMIVNWGLFKEQTADNVLEILRGALAKHGAPNEILTDQGAQFKHWGGVTRFEKLLKKLKIQHIKARSHHPQTLGKIERFHKTGLNKHFHTGIPANLKIFLLSPFIKYLWAFAIFVKPNFRKTFIAVFLNAERS